MPRSVMRAIASREGAKMVDQRAKTGRDAVRVVNRIADLHRVVVYRLRAGEGHRSGNFPRLRCIGLKARMNPLPGFGNPKLVVVLRFFFEGEVGNL